MRHVYRDVVAPSAAPTSTGHHWVDTVAKRAWISVGTSAASDWLEVPNSVGSSAPFADSTSIIKGSADATKLLRIEVDGFTTGTTRVLTPPDQDGTIALLERAQTFSAKQTITPPANTEGIAVSGYSLTAANAQSLMDLAGTWNTSGTPTAIKLNVTDTASNAASLLADLQVGAASKWKADKAGNVTQAGVLLLPDGGASAPSVAPSSDTNTGIYFSGSDAINFTTGGTNRLQLSSSGHLLFIADNTYDIGASGATRPRNIYFGGDLIGNGNLQGATTGIIKFGTSRTTMRTAADGNLQLANQANNAFGLLQFGGISSSFPAIKRSTTKLQMRLADDSAYAAFDVLELQASGTKVVGAQGAAVADASGGGTVDAEARTAINDLLARLRTHGLIAT